MNVLFVHQNFPGQYGALAKRLLAEGHRVLALAVRENQVPAGVELHRYPIDAHMSKDIHPLVKEQEVKIIRAEAVARYCRQLVAEGFVPDVIYVHPGWGESRFLRDVFPAAKIIVYCEFYYAAEGLDVGFDPEFPSSDPNVIYNIRQKNTDKLHCFAFADAFVAPTQWQRSVFPPSLRDRIEVIHDGIDFNWMRKESAIALEVPPGAKIISYVSRNLEPIRGFHQFMRSLPAVLKAVPEALVFIAAREGSGYGVKDQTGLGWKQRMLDELGAELDESRLFFMGWAEKRMYRALLNASDCHVYLTYPFVLSWSLLEAASVCRELVVSDTGPLQEVDMPSMRRVGFFDTEALSEQMIAALNSDAKKPEALAPGLQRYEMETCLQQHLALFNRLTA